MERDYNLRGVGRNIHYSVKERTATADKREHYNLRGVGRAIQYSMEERTMHSYNASYKVCDILYPSYSSGTLLHVSLSYTGHITKALHGHLSMASSLLPLSQAALLLPINASKHLNVMQGLQPCMTSMCFAILCKWLVWFLV